MTLRVTVFCSVVLLFVWLPVQAQPVISAQSGLVSFSEGAVSLDGTAIEQTFGKFAQMKDGSELTSQEGRAEVMLTPGVYIRIGEDSAIRMVSNRLSDTRIEFLNGAAIVDSTTASAKTPITVVCMGYQVQLHEPGRYRFESIPAELRVDRGEAEVLHYGKSATLGSDSVYSFIGGLTLHSSSNGLNDALDDWNRDRNATISASNDQAGKATDLSATLDNWQNDPNAALGALGMSGYLPPIPPSGYGYGPLPTYSPLVSPGYGVNPVYGMYPGSPLGFGMSPLAFYPVPIYGYYPYSTLVGPGYLGSSPFRSGLGYLGSSPLRGGTGIGTYRPPLSSRPISPTYRSPGAFGRVGGGHVGGGHR